MRDALIEEYVEEIGSPSQQAIEALRDSELVALVFDRTAAELRHRAARAVAGERTR